MTDHQDLRKLLSDALKYTEHSRGPHLCAFLKHSEYKCDCGYDDLRSSIDAALSEKVEPVSQGLGKAHIEAIRRQWDADMYPCNAEFYALCNQAISAIAAPADQWRRVEDGLPMIIAGALYDFAGYLTTRPVPVKYGASELAGPMVDALKEWAEIRGLPLDDAAVQSWQEHITRAADQVNAEGQESDKSVKAIRATVAGDTRSPATSAPPSDQPTDAVVVPVAELLVIEAAARAGFVNAQHNYKNLAGDFDSIRHRVSRLRAAQEAK